MREKGTNNKIDDRIKSKCTDSYINFKQSKY